MKITELEIGKTYYKAELRYDYKHKEGAIFKTKRQEGDYNFQGTVSEFKMIKIQEGFLLIESGSLLVNIYENKEEMKEYGDRGDFYDSREEAIRIGIEQEVEWEIKQQQKEVDKAKANIADLQKSITKFKITLTIK